MFVNTGQEFDGSDSGARPDEAVSWGKIKMTASPVKVGLRLEDFMFNRVELFEAPIRINCYGSQYFCLSH